MRPSRLVLEGFTSFRHKIEIDFAGLDLFAITGPTGAGKTSILDAMTYALYGQTPRLGSKGLAELISLGAQRLSVLLDFQTGERRYRVARVMKRNGTPSVRLSALEGRDERPYDLSAKGTVAEIERIVGLDFAAFTKAVMLPQGEFDEFLRGDAAERRRILESLLNLGVYRDMMQRANLLQRTRQAERDTIAVQLEREYADATEANLEALAVELETLLEQSHLAERDLKRVESAFPAALALRGHREVARAAASGREAAEEQLRAERRDRDDIEASIGRERQSVESLNGELTRSAYDQAAHNRLIALLPVAKLLQQTELEMAANTLELPRKSDELAAVRQRLKTEAGRLAKAVADAAQAEAARAAADEKFAALREKHGSVEMVEQVASEMSGVAAVEQQLRRDQDEAASLEKKQREAASRIQQLEKLQAGALKACVKAEREYEGMVRKEAALELRKSLKAGDPCPVCEQPVSRIPRRAAASRVEEARGELKRLEDERRNVDGEVASVAAELASIPRQIERAKVAIERTARQLEDLKQKAARILGGQPRGDVALKLARIAAELRDAESLCSEVERTAWTAAEGLAKAKDSAARLERQEALLAQAVESLASGIEAAAAKSTGLRELVNGSTVESIQAGIAAQETARRQRAAIEESLEQKRQAIEHWLRKSAEGSTRIATLTERVAGLAKSIDSARVQASEIERNLQLGLEGLALPQGRDEAERIERLLTGLRSRSIELGRATEQNRVRAEHLKVRIAEAGSKRAQAADLERSALLYGQLGFSLRADQFIRFILEDAFHLLCEEGAKQLLTLSQGRYSFCTDGDDFQVTDHWNGDERRSVRTLSGGESFLASLALALALSSSVSRFADGRAFRLEALFLDEGFSSLDAESLNVAVQAIEALQEDDRMIGVISHVPDLADRLPGRIQVVKGISGSEIVTSGAGAARA